MGNSVTQEQRDEFLSNAAENGEAQKVDTLLKKGANPNRKLADGERRHRTSLHRAAKTKNNVDVLTKLLTFVKDVDATDSDGNTALHLAAGYYNNAAVVQTLLHAKPNCRIQNSAGQTALHSAVENGSDWKVVELLLLADSDPNISDFEGNTPLHVCTAKRGSDDMIPGILLRFGANPNIKNAEGQTPLHLAAKAGNKVVLLLLKFHAKVRLKDKNGDKASDLADSEDIKRILEFEEECLEERTVRVFSTPPALTMNGSYSSRDLNNYYLGNSAVTPSGNRTHFWADDAGEWKGYGGDGIIHLPDKSDIIVPPQAVPHGTNIKVSIKRSDKNKNEDIPEFDFDLYDFEFDIKLDLPGTLLLAPWMKDSNTTLGALPTHISSPPAFTGLCTEGRNRWKSYREVACQRDGVVGLHFNLTREKGEAMRYKAPLPSRRSTTEVMLQRPPISKYAMDLNGEDYVKSSSSNSSLSSEEETEERFLNLTAGNHEGGDLQNAIGSATLADDVDITLTRKNADNLSAAETHPSSSDSSEDEPLSSDEDTPKNEKNVENHATVKQEIIDYINGERSQNINEEFDFHGTKNDLDMQEVVATNYSSDFGQKNEKPEDQHIGSPEVLENTEEASAKNLQNLSQAEESSAVEDMSTFLKGEISSSSEDEDDNSYHDFEKVGKLPNEEFDNAVDAKAKSSQERDLSYEEIIANYNESNNDETNLYNLQQVEEPRYQHPIDPALATIVEDAENASSIRSEDGSSSESSSEDEKEKVDNLGFETISVNVGVI